MNKPAHRSAGFSNLLVSLLAVFGLLAGGYYNLRYGNWAMEVDASRMSISSEAILETGRLVNPRNYSNGFGYNAQLAFVSLATGIDVQSLQIASGVWVFVVALVAFITFRELLGSTLGGALAAFILMAQPDFLFYVVRGSHEKTTWMYALLMLFFLARSYRHAQQPRKLLIDIILFYLAYWAMTQANVYFASTFMTAILLSVPARFLFEWIFRRRDLHARKGMSWQERMLIISMTCFTLIYIFINYTYQPALAYYNIFSNLIDQISILFFGTESIQTLGSYAYFSTAWRYPQAYAVITAFQWFIAISSVLVWLWASLRFPRLDQKGRLLWQFYTSFGFLLAFSLLADLSGFLSSNLQIRMFTPFALFSSPLVAFGILNAWPRVSTTLRKRLAPVIALVCLFAYLSVQVKITNDPVVANQWHFYSPAEIAAVDWSDQYIEGNLIWVDTRDHLREVIYFLHGFPFTRKNDYVYIPGYPFRYVLISELTQLRANRFGLILPSVVDYHQIYDNGLSRLYKQRSATPFQE